VTKPGFSFFGFVLCCDKFCCGCMFAVVVFDLVFQYSTKERDWLGRTSPK